MRLVPALHFLMALCASAPGLDAVPDVPPPKSWDKFVILIWQNQHRAPDAKAAYESLNLHGFHIDRNDAGLQAFARQSGWPYYVDHACDKGYLHLGTNNSDQDADVAAVIRKNTLIPRPKSLADPAIVAKLHDLLRQNITPAKGSSVVGYAFDDEIGLGSFCSPAEVDTTPQAVEFYRKELEAEYQTIDRLNQEYGENNASFAAVQPISFEQMRGQLSKDNLAKINFAHWCDWRGAMDSHFAEAMADLTRFANSLDNAVPAGFVGGQSPNCWGGYDYRKLCKAIQWIEAYDIGGSNEVLRSFWSQKRPHVQTYFTSKDPHKDAWFLWYYLCQGDRGVIAWPEHWFDNNQPADFLKPMAETYKEVQGPVSQLIINGEFDHDGVAVYYSQPSIQMTWAFDVVCHGGTWIHRLSSMDNTLSTSNLDRVGWLKTLQDVGVQPTFIHQDHLLAGDLVKKGFKVLVLGRILCLSDAEAAAIKAFAKAGGMVIADDCCGIFDQHGKARPAGALDELFSVKRDLGKGWLDGTQLTEVNGEQAQQFNEKNWAVGAPRYKSVAVFERGLSAAGKAKGEQVEGTSVVVRDGKAVYLNLSPVGYLTHRDDSGKPWTELIAGLLKDGGVVPRVTFDGAGDAAKLVESLWWKNGKRTTVCVIKNIDRGATISSFGATKGDLGNGKVKLKLRFAKPVKDLVNERTQKKFGDGAAFEDEFTPWEANVYSIAD